MEYRAKHRFADMSARKLRPFATLIRGRARDEAMELLRFLPNKTPASSSKCSRVHLATPKTVEHATSTIWWSRNRGSMADPS